MFVRIGTAAVQLGMSTHGLRMWEKYGVLKPAFRSAGGMRVYHQHDIDRLALYEKIGDVAKRMCVDVDTVRRLEDQGKIRPSGELCMLKTKFYYKSDVDKLLGVYEKDVLKVYAYYCDGVELSSVKVEEQKEKLENYVAANYEAYTLKEYITDGKTSNKLNSRGLEEVTQLLVTNEVDVLIIIGSDSHRKLRREMGFIRILTDNLGVHFKEVEVDVSDFLFTESEETKFLYDTQNLS